ncbi:hypothetical protein ABEF95_002778 [Exophiala dermatitidis]
MVTRGISTGIAVASEAVAAQKENNSGGNANSRWSEDAEGVYVDQECEFDEAADEEEKEEKEESKPDVTSTTETVEQVSQSFLHSHGLSAEPDFTPKPLPVSVILPQRRPRDRGRGFVRAYAPVLYDCCRIPQQTFLDFLQDFDRASKASPIFDVVNIACLGVGMIPGSIPFAVSSTVGTTSMVLREAFMPYKPGMAEEAFLRVDTSASSSCLNVHSVARSKICGGAGGDNKDSIQIKERLRRLRLSSGAASEALLPEAAPLVYPALDMASSSKAVTESKSGINIKSPVVCECLDRRAQAEFMHEHPGSKPSTMLPPEPKKPVNRFAEPSHPVNSGSIFGLVTGDTWDPIAQGRLRRAEAKAKMNGEPPLTAEERHDAYMGRKVHGRVTGTPSKQLPIIGKLLKKDVLYLAIVDMPTKEELERVQKELECKDD